MIKVSEVTYKAQIREQIFKQITRKIRLNWTKCDSGLADLGEIPWEFPGGHSGGQWLQ